MRWRLAALPALAALAAALACAPWGAPKPMHDLPQTCAEAFAEITPARRPPTFEHDGPWLVGDTVPIYRLEGELSERDRYVRTYGLACAVLGREPVPTPALRAWALAELDEAPDVSEAGPFFEEAPDWEPGRTSRPGVSLRFPGSDDRVRVRGGLPWPADFDHERAHTRASSIHERVAATDLWNDARVGLAPPSPFIPCCGTPPKTFTFSIVNGGAQVQGPSLRVSFHRNGEVSGVGMVEYDVDEVERVPVVLDAAGARARLAQQAADEADRVQGLPGNGVEVMRWSGRAGEDVELMFTVAQGAYGMSRRSLSMVRPDEVLFGMIGY